MKPITEPFADQTFKSLFSELNKKYGDGWSWKKEHYEESIFLSEIYRGLNILAKWQNEGAKNEPELFLRGYSIQEQVIPVLVTEYLGKERCAKPEELRVETRADKFGKFLKWANAHHFEQYTTEQLTEQSGFSYQTTLKYLQETPTFRKLKKGLWEIRDAKSDREAQK